MYAVRISVHHRHRINMEPNMFSSDSSKSSWLFLLMLIGYLSPAVLGDQSCLPSNATSAPNAPVMMDLSNSYSVRVEISVEDGRYIIQARAIVDDEGNRAKIELLQDGTDTTIIFSYDTQEIFYLLDSECTVTSMLNDTKPRIYFGDMYKEGMAYIPDPKTAFWLNDNIKRIYIGSATVRGIQCDHWRSCIISPPSGSISNENFTIDYYFSSRGWTSASSYMMVPVRYDVRGQQLQAHGPPRPFHRIYDFYEYKSDAFMNDPTEFEIPEGVACPGRRVTKTLPTVSLQAGTFYFRQEMVDQTGSDIEQADVWFDPKFKLARVDYRHGNSMQPYTEIHDFTYGVKYLKNRQTGDCQVGPLDRTSFDAKLDVQAFKANGSFVLRMKEPLAFFYLDSQFTYSGTRNTRDIPCDVFISQRNDFDPFNNGSGYNAKVEAYFLQEGWAEVPNNEIKDFTQMFPIRIEVWIPVLNLNMVYNIFDYNLDPADYDIFDVSDCYNDSKRLDFQVWFPGKYKSDTEHAFRVQGQSTLAQVMKVSSLRVTRLRVKYDGSYVYLTASLLGPSPSLAQFTHLPGTVIEKNDDAGWANIDSPAACSDLCVNNPLFTCKSFEYCPADRHGCRLSKLHVGDQGAVVIPGICDLYSRSVNTPNTDPELSVSEAYANLLETIGSQQLSISVQEDDQSMGVYLAVHSEILFGQEDPVPLPSLSGQFSYRVEFINTETQYVSTYDVWYDSTSKLVRYDYRDVTAGPPYYTPYRITQIHDYNTGVAYNIDTKQKNCTVTPIPSSKSGSFDTSPQNSTRVKAGIDMRRLKSPLELFYLDNTYRYTGQQTVRGILCDVFESRRTDFSVQDGTSNNVQHSTFQYYFQASSWSYIADTHSDTTQLQPVRLNVWDGEENSFFIYNFYDFNDEHIAYDIFDITPCFTDDQRHDFVIDFNQTYHPYLDLNEWKFKENVQLLIASQTRISPLRIQNLQITYNMDQTYAIATLLGQVSPTNFFSEDGTVVPYKATQVLPQANVNICAASCYTNKQIICNSFDLCDDQTCLLSTKHIPDGNSTGKSGPCRHFSRVTNGTGPETIMSDAYTILKDLVYKGIFAVEIPYGNNTSQTVVYTAIGIRDDILRQSAAGETGGADLRKFTKYQGGASLTGTPVDQQSGLAVDDCATICLNNNMFECLAFDFCYTTGECSLYSNHPEQHPELIGQNPYCDLYSRQYTQDYTLYPGLVFESIQAQNKVQTVSLEMCAKQCSSTTNTFDCRSFDFCESTQSCLLYNVHIIDIDPSAIKNNSFCEHYSRNYLHDFRMMSQTMLPGYDDVILEGLDVMNCARLCVQQTNCQSFEFCAGECRLSTASSSLTYAATRNGSCDLYLFNSIVAPTRPSQGSTLLPHNISTRASPPVSHTSRTTSQPTTSAGTTSQPTTSARTTSNPPTKRFTAGTTSKPTTSTRTTSHPSTKWFTASRKPTTSGDSQTNSRTTPHQFFRRRSVTASYSTVSHPERHHTTTGCQGKQTASQSSSDSGPRAGIAVGMLIIGIFIGILTMLLVQRFRNKVNQVERMELVSPSAR